MTTQHTPGPWSIDDTGAAIYGAQCTYDALRVCQVTDGSKQAANARIIAAAPELLAACEMVDKIWNAASPNPESPAAILRAAIAKAKGPQ